jgi:uncharacterized protein
VFRLVTPHYRVRRVAELTPERLRQWSIGALLLDVDCTLTRYRQGEPTAEAAVWIDDVRRAGIRLCLLSNGLGGRIRRFAERLGLPCIGGAMKPLPHGVWRALHEIGAKRSETAIVGDQLFADVMAGRLAGIRTILVEPIQPEEEPWFTRTKRLPERLILGRLS